MPQRSNGRPHGWQLQTIKIYLTLGGRPRVDPKLLEPTITLTNMNANTTIIPFILGSRVTGNVTRGPLPLPSSAIFPTGCPLMTMSNLAELQKQGKQQPPQGTSDAGLKVTFPCPMVLFTLKVCRLLRAKGLLIGLRAPRCLPPLRILYP